MRGRRGSVGDPPLTCGEAVELISAFLDGELGVSDTVRLQPPVHHKLNYSGSWVETHATIKE